MTAGAPGLVRFRAPSFRRMEAGREHYSTATEWGNSLWSTLGRCKRKYFNTYVLGLEPHRPRKGLDRGTAVHRGWDAYHKGEKYARVVSIVEETAVQDDAREQAVRMIRWYMDEFPRSAFRVVCGSEVHHEATFTTRIGDQTITFPLTTRYDCLAIPKDSNEVEWVDLKTQTDFSGERMLRYLAEPQLMQGVAIWDAAGPPKELRRRKNVPKWLTPRIFVLHESSKNKKMGYHESPFYVSRAHVASLIESRAFEAAFELAALEHHYGVERPWPQDWGNCFDTYGACEFFDLCHTSGEAKDLYYLKPNHKPRWVLSTLATEEKRAP